MIIYKRKMLKFNNTNNMVKTQSIIYEISNTQAPMIPLECFLFMSKRKEYPLASNFKEMSPFK